MKSLLASFYRVLPVSFVKAVLRLTNTSFIVSVVGIFFDSQGKVLVLRHVFRRRRPWGLPSGFLEADESPEAGLLRELKEETGLSGQVSRFLAAVPVSPRHLEVVLVGMLDSMQPITLNHEIFEAVFADPADLPADMPQGQKDLVRRAAASM